MARVTRFGDDTTGLWDSLLGASGAGTRRSAAFLNWRYAEHPVFAYQLFEVRSEDALAGVGIFRVESVRDTPLKVGRLVELLAKPFAAPALIQAMLEELEAEDVAFADFFCSDGDYDALIEQGFSCGDSNTRRLPILFQPIDHRRKGIPFMAHVGKLGAQLLEPQWYVTKGDGDQDRPN